MQDTHHKCVSAKRQLFCLDPLSLYTNRYRMNTTARLYDIIAGVETEFFTCGEGRYYDFVTKGRYRYYVPRA